MFFSKTSPLKIENTPSMNLVKSWSKIGHFEPNSCRFWSFHPSDFPWIKLVSLYIPYEREREQSHAGSESEGVKKSNYPVTTISWPVFFTSPFMAKTLLLQARKSEPKVTFKNHAKFGSQPTNFVKPWKLVQYIRKVYAILVALEVIPLKIIGYFESPLDPLRQLNCTFMEWFFN